tara:strand:+ start:6624 stop:7955 length:1332 start_codon:yes stop_codon:yes gene_type:complete
MSKCEIKPISAFQSTNLNNKINTFNDVSDRILHTLGYPFINIEIHRDSLYTNIQLAVEMFTKFAGYTQEYLLFDSNLYNVNQGIRLDHLMSINPTASAPSSAVTRDEKLAVRAKDEALYQGQSVESKDFSTYLRSPTDPAEEGGSLFVADNLPKESLYITTSAMPAYYFGVGDGGGTLDGRVGMIDTTTANISALSGAFKQGTFVNQILTQEFYDIFSNTTAFSAISSHFTESKKTEFTIRGEKKYEEVGFMNSFDYDVMDYRKVIAVQDFEEGSTTGINTLFTIEQTLAQQTYFSYAMGNYGFDLISWYILKDWLEMREKLLATKRSYTFDERTQILRMYPQPRSSGSNGARFYGVVSCQVERPIRDVIKEHWVYQYALALTKITVANIRGKYGSVNLFGQGQLNYNDLMSQGLAEKAALEEKLYTGAPGMGDAEPPLFFVG